MHAFRKKRGLVNWDWYFGERMDISSLCEKDKKRLRTDVIGKCLYMLCLC